MRLNSHIESRYSNKLTQIDFSLFVHFTLQPWAKISCCMMVAIATWGWSTQPEKHTIIKTIKSYTIDDMLHSFYNKIIPVIIHIYQYLAHLLSLFSLFPSLFWKPTVAKSQSKIKQYASICYSNPLKLTKIFC